MLKAYKQSQQSRAVPIRRSSPGGDPCVRFDAQRPASLLFAGTATLGEEQRVALRTLQRDPLRWVRPQTDARLLAYLVLALEGLVVAIEDEHGMRFRVTAVGRTPRPPREISESTDVKRVSDSQRVPGCAG